MESVREDIDVEVGGIDNEYEARMLEAFVGKPDRPDKGLWYANAFSRYEVDGVEKIQWTWSWWAFFGGIWFLIYRKAYAAAGALLLISLLAQMIPPAGIIVSVLAGGFSPYFVYRIYKTKKLEIETAEQNEERRIVMMREIGGYNQWAVYVAVVLSVIAFFGVVAAITLPEVAGS